jgi:hypothetical protein
VEGKSDPLSLQQCELVAKPGDTYCGAVCPQSVSQGAWYFEAELLQGTQVRIGLAATKKINGGGCDESCSRSHSSDGNCLVCGRGWGPHSGHTCQEGTRGSWPIDGVGGKTANIGLGKSDVAWAPSESTLIVHGTETKLHGSIKAAVNDRVGCMVSFELGKAWVTFFCKGQACTGRVLVCVFIIIYF